MPRNDNQVLAALQAVTNTMLQIGAQQQQWAIAQQRMALEAKTLDLREKYNQQQALAQKNLTDYRNAQIEHMKKLEERAAKAGIEKDTKFARWMQEERLQAEKDYRAVVEEEVIETLSSENENFSEFYSFESIEDIGKTLRGLQKRQATLVRQAKGDLSDVDSQFALQTLVNKGLTREQAVQQIGGNATEELRILKVKELADFHDQVATQTRRIHKMDKATQRRELREEILKGFKPEGEKKTTGVEQVPKNLVELSSADPLPLEREMRELDMEKILTDSFANKLLQRTATSQKDFASAWEEVRDMANVPGDKKATLERLSLVVTELQRKFESTKDKKVTDDELDRMYELIQQYVNNMPGNEP